MSLIKLELINEDDIPAPDFDQFQNWLNQVALKLKTTGTVCIKIIDATESQSLNNTYRGKNKPTNVLSFPADIPEFVASDELGDLAICATVVEHEATEQNKPLEHHWAHMCIHGILHLLGFDHIDENDAEEMESLEIDILFTLGIENPYH
ncbi:MAG: rRNA maturation RNase YbeY [Marinicella sp.]